jgi:hypothetical protein
MPFYSEIQIRTCHAEFKRLKKYTDKLIFFDRLFGIIPFSFPDFDPQLRYFFQKEKMTELSDIFRKERNNPGLNEKKFSFAEDFVFNIRPANSNSATYSNYILSSFLSRTPVFKEWIRQRKTADKPVEFFLDEANGLINRIENALQNEQEKGFNFQCMAVFYKGFYDAFSNQVNLPGKKRKFIELYLYAQGIIYANYINSLKTALQQSRNPVELQRSSCLDLPGKLGLMQELGIIEFLKSRYTGLDVISFENKVAEILCLITGEYTDQKETVLKILSAMNRQNPGGSSKMNSSGMHQKIIKMTTGK